MPTLRGDSGAEGRHRLLSAVETEVKARLPDAARASEVLVALDEIVTNVCNHGYGVGNVGPIEVDVEATDGQLRVDVRDQAPPFDPTAVELQPVSTDINLAPVGGLGILLVREMMDELVYTHDGGNCLSLRVNIKDNSDQEAACSK